MEIQNSSVSSNEVQVDALIGRFEKMLSSKDFLDAVFDKIALGGYPLLADPLFFLTMEASKEGADFIREHMGDAVLFRGHYENDNFWKHSLDLVKTEGLFLEFGVYSGTSINFFADCRQDVVFHGFDSFEGLPSDWHGWVGAKGRFGRDGMPEVRSNVVLHKGWFDATIPVFAQENKDKIAFLHIDCDLYESTKSVFDLLGDRIQKGTVIIFDEYLNYPAWKLHEHKAFVEFCQKRNIQSRYKAFKGQKATVIIDSID